MLKHNYIGTEHLLLGLLREDEGLAGRVLESLDLTVERARMQVQRIIGLGDKLTEGQVPFTPRAKKVLELSLREAMSLDHNYIGTEHILLGLARENEGVAFRILLEFDANAERIRTEVIRMLSDPGYRHRVEVSPERRRTPRQTIEPGWLDGLERMLDQFADEIRRELGREPDAGDLLLVLSAAPQTIPAQALEQLGVDLDELWGQIERLRRQARDAREELAQRITQARVAKEQAIETEQFQTAARLRDQERELTRQQRWQTIVSSQALNDVRRRLGLPAPPEPPTTTSS